MLLHQKSLDLLSSDPSSIVSSFSITPSLNTAAVMFSTIRPSGLRDQLEVDRKVTIVPSTQEGLARQSLLEQHSLHWQAQRR